jgi:glycosyltransferase involved in cell wall biosynthesis
MPRLALNLLVLNGAKVLPRMLNSLRGALDELVIVDTGSGDTTYEVLQQLASEHHLQRFWYERMNPQSEDYFEDSPHNFPASLEPSGRRLLADWSKARNLLLDHTTADYVLKMDADDELLTPAPNLLTTCACLDQNRQISFIDALYEIMEGGTHIELQMYTRVWRRCPEIRWQQPCHEYLSGKTQENTFQTRSGLRVRDWRDSPGTGVRVPYRNLKVLEKHRQGNKAIMDADTKEGVLFRYTWATEAVPVWPDKAHRELHRLLPLIDERDTGFLADLHFQIGRAREALPTWRQDVQASYEQALKLNPYHFPSIIQLFKLLDTDDLRDDNSVVLDKLRVGLKVLPPGMIPCGCDLRAWRQLRGEP